MRLLVILVPEAWPAPRRYRESAPEDEEEEEEEEKENR